jgi:hypothetical protein
MQCMLESNIYFNPQGCEQDQKNKFRPEDSSRPLIWHETYGAQNLIDHN